MKALTELLNKQQMTYRRRNDLLISREEENQKTIQFRTRFHESVLKELDEYCKWAQINSRDYFIEQACIYIFKNSNRWKVFKEENQSGNS